MFRKTVIATVICLTMGVTSQSHAFGFPQTDVLKIAKQVYQRMESAMQHAADFAMSQKEMLLANQTSADKMDEMNNAANNAIVRINQAKTDIQNLLQMERSMPAPETCSTTLVSVSLEDALCKEQSIFSQINSLRTKIYSSVSGYVDAVTLQDHQIGEMSLAQSTGGSKSNTPVKTAAQLAVEEFEKNTLGEFAKLKAHTAAGRDEQVTNPELFLIHDSSPFTFTPEELDIAKSRLFLEYPPYVNLSGDDPATDRVSVLERRKVLAQEMSAQVVAKHIALKAPVKEGFPSRLGAMQIASKVRLMPDGSFDKSEESFMQKMAMKNPGEGATSREKIIMRSVQLSGAIERYKQTLALEHHLLMIAANKLDNPKK